MKRSLLAFFTATVITLAGSTRVNSQNALPDVFEKGSVEEQLKYVEDRTRIYENYRAIREDMFRAVSRNTMDTLKAAKAGIRKLDLQVAALNNRIDSLSRGMEEADSKLQLAVRTKESIGVLGMEVNKNLYNSVMWTVLAGLLFLLVVGYLSFRRNRAITIRTRKDLEELKEEFEAYRQKVRIEREKTNLEHFNEIKKLKGLQK